MHLAGQEGFAPRVDVATDDHLTVQSLVAAGLGVSLLPALGLRSALRPDVALRPVAGGAGRAVEAVLPAAERRPPAVTAFVGALRAAAHALAAEPASAALGLRAA